MSTIKQNLFHAFAASATGLYAFRATQAVAEQISTSPHPVTSGILATAFVGAGAALWMALAHSVNKEFKTPLPKQAL